MSLREINNRIDCSIVIVTYNTSELLKKTLTALLHSLRLTSFSYEVIIVDNASHDETASMVQKEFPQLTYIQNIENRGFAYGNNIGIRRSTGRYVLLLNSDVLVEDRVLDVMVKYMDNHPQVGVSTCRVVFPNGKPDPAAHRGFPDPWASFTYFFGLEKMFPQHTLFARYHMTYMDLQEEHEIDSPSGAFYLARSRAIGEVGELDEQFFMYAEDLDWSMRFKKKGWKIMFVPGVQVIHLKKQSGRNSTNRAVRKKTTQAFYDTMVLFYRKYYEQQYPFIINQLVYLAITVKKSLALLFI